MSHVVRIRTGARLHFGLWGINAPKGRRFGGVGMMVAEPGVVLAARPAECDQINADSPDVVARVAHLLRRLRSQRPDIPPVSLQISAAIPSHLGLGSGTQLGLATATAVLKLTGDESFDAAAWAHPLGRGERSSIGVHGFEVGGFLVEAGQLPGDCIGELIGRANLCDDWRIVLIAPPQITGLSGAAERSAFQQLPPMSDAVTTALQRIAIDTWLPAVTAADFAAASTAMWEYGQTAGGYFRAVQGGVFASPRMEQLAVRLRTDGVTGIAQTSWGPTIAVLCCDQQQAEMLRNQLACDAAWQDSSVRITRPLNTGAVVE